VSKHCENCPTKVDHSFLETSEYGQQTLMHRHQLHPRKNEAGPALRAIPAVTNLLLYWRRLYALPLGLFFLSAPCHLRGLPAHLPGTRQGSVHLTCTASQHVHTNIHQGSVRATLPTTTGQGLVRARKPRGPSKHCSIAPRQRRQTKASASAPACLSLWAPVCGVHQGYGLSQLCPCPPTGPNPARPLPSWASPTVYHPSTMSLVMETGRTIRGGGGGVGGSTQTG